MLVLYCRAFGIYIILHVCDRKKKRRRRRRARGAISVGFGCHFWATFSVVQKIACLVFAKFLVLVMVLSKTEKSSINKAHIEGFLLNSSENNIVIFIIKIHEIVRGAHFLLLVMKFRPKIEKIIKKNKKMSYPHNFRDFDDEIHS